MFGSNYKQITTGRHLLWSRFNDNQWSNVYFTYNSEILWLYFQRKGIKLRENTKIQWVFKFLDLQNEDYLNCCLCVYHGNIEWSYIKTQLTYLNIPRKHDNLETVSKLHGALKIARAHKTLCLGIIIKRQIITHKISQIIFDVQNFNTVLH
jgi:hypothetical protein